MRLTFLGTAASEGYPDAFCDCDNCRRAREVGGKSLRKRCSALIDHDLLIDLGPDLMVAAQVHGLSLASIEHCLQTHEHADHLEPSHFASRSPLSGVHGNPRLTYYASRGALEKAARALGSRVPPAGLLDPIMQERLNVAVRVVAPFETFDAGPYRVTSVAANHADLEALLYVIQRDSRTLFYATDTSELPEETWRALRGLGTRIDVVAMDHTFGMQARSKGHMNWEQFVEQIERMRAERLLSDGARVYAVHLGHHSNPIHEELAAFAAEHGYEIAYDGLVIDV